MRKLLVIGIGAGNPDYITIQAIKALNQASVFFVADKGDDKDALVALRREICQRFIEQPGYRMVAIQDPVRDANIADYAERVRVWHEQRASLFEEAILRELPEDGCGAFLVWGDPSLYDSTLRIIEQLLTRAKVSFDYEVIPGISSVQALAARHRLILNRIGGALQITTGRLLSEGFPDDVNDVVVMLDGECTFKKLQNTDLEIYWGAYLGAPNELLVSGDLNERADEIERLRNEARDREGWIMDTYLLRKKRP